MGPDRTRVYKVWRLPVVWIGCLEPQPAITAAAGTVWRATVVEVRPESLPAPGRPAIAALPPGSAVTTEEEE